MNSWYKGMDYCSWDGVACDGATGNVIGLDLTCSWLRGTLHSNSSLFLLRHLRNLNLFGGIFSYAVFQLPSLTTLYLFSNYNLSRILPKFNWTSPLESLSLWSMNFSGEIPDSIVLWIDGNSFCGVVEFELFTKLKNLQILFVSQELNLIYDTLEYTFPKLERLRLRSCNLTRLPYFLNSLERLTYLDLSSNRIGGEIPMWFWGISHDTLETLILSNNLLEGGIQLLNNFTSEIPSLICQFGSLQYLELSNNNFTSEIPSSICQFSSLQYLGLSNNNFFGNMSLCLGNITNLMFMNLSNNRLQGPLPRSLVKCVNLSTLDFSHNEFSDTFPHWLKASQLYTLDLQSNKFHGRINLTAFGLSFSALGNLFISNNNFIGQWPIEFFSNTSLDIIDLSNNKFGGPIPLPSPFTYYYSIASNNITGKIPSLICNATGLGIIDLSNNSLMGSLPRCLTNFSTNLLVLNLRMNHLEGTLPHLLVKCRYLEVLDLSHNQIEDTFSRWLGTLPELKVLVLRSNNLKDLLDIPRGARLFSKLHILDLSNNSFSGPLPANLIMKLKGMMNGKNMQDTSLYMTKSFGSGTCENSVAVMMKGLEVELVKILTFLTIIDLSCNSFQGKIPKVIGHLHFLIELNLSHNHLTGSIPSTLGNLTNLEWLDLSSNKFSGLIPRKLGDLASLGYLNLSKNQLTGRIPQDKQLSTFSSNSFSLCGTPLPKACPSDAQPPPPSSLLTFNFKEHERWLKQKI
ncbi:hypothetical protein EUGRSUZ_F00660, partial [Eucalyptus grandis]